LVVGPWHWRRLERLAGQDQGHLPAGKGFTRPWPDEIRMDEKTKKRVGEKWKTLGL
jgi:hypothetical protein